MTEMEEHVLGSVLINESSSIERIKRTARGSSLIDLFPQLAEKCSSSLTTLSTKLMKVDDAVSVHVSCEELDKKNAGWQHQEILLKLAF